MKEVTFMELRQIEYFIEVAKREHMTEAAAVLHVAQYGGSVDKYFNLEAELGVDLFFPRRTQDKTNTYWKNVFRIYGTSCWS